MVKTAYDLKDVSNINSPALIYYEDIIRKNALEVIRVAGGANRLWPHVKTHKMSAMIRLLQEMGINRFKCATIAEAEMLAQCNVQDILVAYPLIGPSIPRFISLIEKYENSRWWTIGDNTHQLRELGCQAEAVGVEVNVLADVDMGMQRTGVSFAELEGFYEECSNIAGITVLGFHGYDGSNIDPSLETRKKETARTEEALSSIKASLLSKGFSCDVIVVGGTPSFTCHAEYAGVYLSPGTVFVHDYGYLKYTELKLTPGAALLARVISCPGNGRFTLDLGYKGVSSDPVGVRGVIASIPDSEHVGHSEEHWIFRMKDGCEEHMPSVGDALYVIPTHVCPTTALYPYALVARGGDIVGEWEVTARNRKISI